MHFLGIDIGTSAVKAILVDERQTVVAQASAFVTTTSPRSGWYEQDPSDWWSAVETTVAALRRAAPTAFAEVRAIGLSGQMHSPVLLDAADEVIRPAILWNDSRGVEECAVLSAVVPNLAEIAGIIAMPGFTAPKLLWLRTHEPEAFARVSRVLLAKDYVRFRLTGEFATDVVDAAGTLLLDEAERQWSALLIAATSLRPEQLPVLLESNAASGFVRPEIAAAWGFDRSVLVAAGAGDTPAGAIGIGAINDGDSFVSVGTSAQIFRTRDRYEPKPATLIHVFAFALPGRWYEQAALLNGAGCLDWIGRVLGTDALTLLERVEASFRGPAPVMFLPYLAGERTPLNDPDARGAFAHLEYATSPADLAQAVLEGVAYSLVDGIHAFGDFGNAPMPMIGGGARSRLWMRIIASAIGRPLQRIATADSSSAFAAARLARMALTGEVPATVCTKPAVVETIDPERALGRAYAERFPAFQNLYRSLRRVREATADRRPVVMR